MKNDITEWHKRSIHQDIIILNVYTANKRTTEHTKQKWTEMKTETDKSVYIAEDFNEHFSLKHRTNRKISNSTEEMNQVHVTFIEQSTHQKWNTHFQAHMDQMFTKTDHILALQTTQHIWRNWNPTKHVLWPKQITPEISNRKGKKKKTSNPWKLNSIFF